jgi:hypothetical protein
VVYLPQQVPWAPPPPEEEEAEEVAIPVEEYQPSDLWEEEAIRRDIVESKLLELGLCDGLCAQLPASATSSTTGANSSNTSASSSTTSPPPPLPPEPEPQVGWAHTVWESLSHAPPIQVN